MQNVVYCRKCKKYVPFKKAEEVAERITEEFKFYYMEEVSKCDICGTNIYINSNIRNNLYKVADIYKDIIEMRKN